MGNQPVHESDGSSPSSSSSPTSSSSSSVTIDPPASSPDSPQIRITILPKKTSSRLSIFRKKSGTKKSQRNPSSSSSSSSSRSKPVVIDTAFIDSLPELKASIATSLAEQSCPVALLLEDNLPHALKLLETADLLSQSDDGQSIFLLRTSPRLRSRANGNYQAWIDLLSREIRASLVEFTQRAALLPGESPANVILQIKDRLSLVEPTSNAEKLRLDFLKDLVEEVKRNDVLPIASFVPPLLQADVKHFLNQQVLPLIRGGKKLSDVNAALFDHLDAVSRHLRGIRAVSLGGRTVSAQEVKEIVEQVLLSQVAMFNYHGTDPNAEIRNARAELNLIRARLDETRAAQPALLEIVSDFFVGAYTALLSKVVAGEGGGGEGSSGSKPDALQFSPKNVFFVLMSEFVQHLLLCLPARLANGILVQHRNVLFSSETMLDSATKLLEAEDYFQCGPLRAYYERFLLPQASDESRMDLLFAVAAGQFWRVIKGDAKQRTFDAVLLLLAPLLQPDAPAHPRALQFLLAAHRVLHSLGGCHAAAAASSPELETACSAEAPDQASPAAVLPDVEAAVLRMLGELTPESSEAWRRENLGLLFRAFYRALSFSREVSADVWPPVWRNYLVSMGESVIIHIPHDQPQSQPQSQQHQQQPTNNSDLISTSTSNSTSTSDSSVTTQSPLAAALHSQDLMTISTLLRDSSWAEGSAELQFSRALRTWMIDFLDLYRARFDFICPFGMGIESFQCDEDNGARLPGDEVRAYTLSTGTVVSEFGRRGMGLPRLEDYERVTVGHYTPRDPVRRTPVAFYFRDRKAERAIINIFASLKRLALAIQSMSALSVPDHFQPILVIMQRYLDQFDSTFLEKRIQQLDPN